MLHLDPDRLAALADSDPTPDEAAHLSVCAYCARERAAARELLALAASVHNPEPAEPLTDWPSLSARLAEKGIMRTSGSTAMRTRPRLWLQAAAAVLLAAGGLVVGRATARYPLPSGSRAASAGSPAIARTASTDTGRAVVSLDDALALMQRAESDYRLATAYIAAHDTVPANAPGRGVDRYRARLAALDRVSDAALAAVNEAPSDPIINQYLLSARTARAVTLQQLNSSLPAGVTLASY